MEELIPQFGRKRLEALIQKFLDSNQDFQIDLEGIVTIDASGDGNKFIWTSGYTVGSEYTKIFEQLMLDGKLQQTVSAKQLFELQNVATNTEGAAIDALGRYFEAAFVYELEKEAHRRGLEGSAAPSVEYDMYKKRLEGYGLESDIAQINSIAAAAAKQVLPDSCEEVLIKAIGKSSVEGDASIEINGKTIMFELKYLTDKGRSVKWFTLSDSNFNKTLLQAAHKSGADALWDQDHKLKTTDEWTASVREFAVNQYAKEIMTGASPDAKNLLLFLIEKGGQVKTGPSYQKKILRGFRPTSSTSFEVSIDLDTMMEKVDDQSKLEMESRGVSLNFFLDDTRIANLTTEKPTVSKYSAEYFSLNGHEPTEKETTTFLFFLQAGFFDNLG